MVLLAALLWSSAAVAQPWDRVGVSDGVIISMQPDEGRKVPRFRGVAEVQEPLWHLVAVLGDAERTCEWNPALSECRTVRRTSDVDFRLYARLAAPWPIDDRDAVIESKLVSDATGDRVIASFRAVGDPGVPIPANVVRFPKLYGHYRLVRLGPRRTRVEYFVDADPGGMLPAWVVRFIVREMPVAAVAGLRQQGRATRGQYASFVARHDPSAGLPAAPPPPVTNGPEAQGGSRAAGGTGRPRSVAAAER